MTLLIVQCLLAFCGGVVVGLSTAAFLIIAPFERED